MRRITKTLISVLFLLTTSAQAAGIAAYYTASFPILKYKLYGKHEYKDFDSAGLLGVTVKGYHMLSAKIGIEGYLAYTSGYKEELYYGSDYKLRRAGGGAGLIYRFHGGGFSFWSFYAEGGPIIQWTEFEEYNSNYTEELNSSFNYGAFIGLGVKRRLSQRISIDFNPHYTAIFNANSHEDDNVEHLDFFDIRLGAAIDF